MELTPNSASEHLSDLKWSAILNGIRDRKCVIFLGSELYTPVDGVDTQSQYSKLLFEHRV